VAQRAGVSAATVSNSLHHSERLAPATRTRIHTAITELRYQPSVAARALRGRQHRGHRSQTDRTAPTIRDVARLAGVCYQTVSHVLNRPDRVRPDTLHRVAAAMQALSYQANSDAQALRRLAPHPAGRPAWQHALRPIPAPDSASPEEGR
jgi:DNA-binding LacI/PurR family transcriptional regulator